LLLVLAFAPSAPAIAQQPAAPAAPATPAASTTTLSVFADCPNVGCDFDYFRTEITAVNWVRDREVSDVHILVTGEDTGAGGRKFTVAFIGLRAYAGLNDTLSFSLPPSFTEDDRRSGLVKHFRIGLVRYLSRTPALSGISVTLPSGSTSGAQTTAKADKWNAWVFSLNASVNGYAEETYKSYSVRGEFRANRITERWKTQFTTRENYNQDENQLDDTTRTIIIRRNYTFTALQARSLTSHLSVGLRADAVSSTYENTRRGIRVSPAVEYNVYPYSQSTRRQLKVEYAVGMADYQYSDTTIYNKVHESLPLHRFSTYLSQKQPWGTIDFRVNGTQYLNDRTKYRVGIGGYAEVKIFKGFSVYGDGGYDIVHDQLSLLKKNFTPQEILLRQFQRGSTYFYYAYFGLQYTFGSIYNNVVNPRFD
jgi:hypothetical protein